MSYESRIYIVEKSRNIGDNGKRFGEVIAKFNLSCIRNISNNLRNLPATDCYIYADVSETQIIEDNYGETLKECTPAHLINLIEKEIENGEDYRRLFPILATLKAIEERRKQWGDIVCLHYGY